MKTIPYIMAVIALVALLLVGSAFATEDSAASVQATHLQLNIDKALIVGAEVIVKVNNSNQSTTSLQAILDDLIDLRGSITPDNTTVEAVQAQRKQAADLVKAFKDAAKDLLNETEKSGCKERAEKKFEDKFKDKLHKVSEMCGKLNEKAFSHFAENAQHNALGLSDDLNVSITPELAAKLAEIKARIESCNVTREQVAEMRTKVKVEVEALKERRGEVVADIRADVLKHQSDALEQVIAAATQQNISTDDLQNIQAKIVALLEKYANNETTADEFTAQVKVLHGELVKAYAAIAPQLTHIRLDVRLDNKDERVELRHETKNEWKNWTTERKQMMTDIKDSRKEIRSFIQNGTMHYEIRERMKDGIVEQRLKIRADKSGSNDDSSDDLEDDSDDDSNESEIEIEAGVQ